MKKLIAKKDFIVDGSPYIKGDAIEVKDIATIRKLNEKGFIEPLDFKELIIVERQLKNGYKEEE